MSQQLQLLLEPPSVPLTRDSIADLSVSDLPVCDLPVSDLSDPLLEQTRQLFQHRGSNTELMTQILHAIQALNEICEQPKQQGQMP
jgi:hypothetical protein